MKIKSHSKTILGLLAAGVLVVGAGCLNQNGTSPTSTDSGVTTTPEVTTSTNGLTYAFGPTAIQLGMATSSWSDIDFVTTTSTYPLESGERPVFTALALGSKELAQKGGQNCTLKVDMTTTSVPLGFLVFSTHLVDITGTVTRTPMAGVDKKIGESYVTYFPPMIPCSNRADIISLQNKKVKLVEDAFNVINIKTSD